MDDEQITVLWQFIRGDMSVSQFEEWLYAQSNLVEAFGSDLHLELLSTNYRNHDEVFDIKQKLRGTLRLPLICECITLPTIAAVPMGMDGLDERFFATIEEVCAHAPHLWWLHLSRCRVCGQNWMIATEERIYDDHFLKRLSGEDAQKIIDSDNWPQDFSTYEKVLALGRQISKACQFFDPLSSALVDTVRDLRTSRPDISETELGSLLGIEIEHARELVAMI